mmetsp:Transcript_56893/g.94149  ORF Transcript_56893/g.94149 Transcript_56893/m.94149 type:complete len:82 (-) Transcript_56893:713-958(-)
MPNKHRAHPEVLIEEAEEHVNSVGSNQGGLLDPTVDLARGEGIDRPSYDWTVQTQRDRRGPCKEAGDHCVAQQPASTKWQH